MIKSLICFVISIDKKEEKKLAAYITFGDI